MNARCFFFLVGGDRIEWRTRVSESRSGEKKLYVLTKWPAPRRIDCSVGRALYRYYSGQNIALIEVPFSRTFLTVACGMSLRDVQTIQLSNMLARDLFTSSHVHFRRIEPNKCFLLSRIGLFLQEPFRCCSDRFISFGKHCWTDGGSNTQVTGHGSWVTGHRSWVTGHGSRVAGHR